MSNTMSPEVDKHSLTDAVCGMSVNKNSEHHGVYGDVTYFFCSQGCECETRFALTPAK